MIVALGSLVNEGHSGAGSREPFTNFIIMQDHPSSEGEIFLAYLDLAARIFEALYPQEA